MTPLPLRFLALLIAGWASRHQHEMIEYLQAENSVLRHQLGGKRVLFTDAQRRRLARYAHVVGRRRLREIPTIVTPVTLLRSYRELVAKKYDGSSKRGPGRPRIPGEIEGLIVEMARDNPRWGYTRIQGALQNLGYIVARNTIKRVLVENGIDPAGQRRTTWKSFLRAHWGAIAATDLFTVEVVTWRGSCSLLRALRDRLEDPEGRDRGNHVLAHRSLGEPDRAEFDERGRGIPRRQPLSDSRSRPAIHERIRRHTPQFGCRADQATATKSKLERSRRALRPINQVGVPGARDSARRAPSATCRARVHRALTRGTESPGNREPADPPRGSRVSRRRPGRVFGTPRRPAAALP